MVTMETFNDRKLISDIRIMLVMSSSEEFSSIRARTFVRTQLTVETNVANETNKIKQVKGDTPLLEVVTLTALAGGLEGFIFILASFFAASINFHCQLLLQRIYFFVTCAHSQNLSRMKVECECSLQRKDSGNRK